jgi:ubiquinol oxidase
MVMPVDLKTEQQASLGRPRYPYSAVARFFFLGMDVLAGSETTLAKAKLIEALAGVPYRAWEDRQYLRMVRHYREEELVRTAREILAWAREARDREYWHLLVIEEKMREDGARDPWYLSSPLPQLMVGSYALLAWVMALVNIRRGYLLNAEFEDHAEHTYAQLVRDHPEWEEQAVAGDVVATRGSFESWADVFRRIGLDERDHMNESFAYCGRPDRVVQYEGMPGTE